MNSGENFPHGTRRGRGTIRKHSRWHSSSYQGLLPEEMIYLNPNLINPVGVLLEPNLSGKGKYPTLAPSSLLPGGWKYSTYFQMSPAILSHLWRVGTEKHCWTSQSRDMGLPKNWDLIIGLIECFLPHYILTTTLSKAYLQNVFYSVYNVCFSTKSYKA